MPMPPLPSVPSSRPSPTDPLYSSSTLTPSSATPPPSYRSTRPASSEPATYGSLADLTKNKPARQTQTQAFSYTPQPERQGYRSAYDEVPTGTGAGRKMPPPPGNYGVDANPAPPRRNAPTPGERPARAPPAGGNSYLATAQSYIPAGVSSGASSAAERVRDGFGSIATQERKSQVIGGVGKVAAGAVKLTGKAVWQIGKFAAK